MPAGPQEPRMGLDAHGRRTLQVHRAKAADNSRGARLRRAGLKGDTTRNAWLPE